MTIHSVDVRVQRNKIRRPKLLLLAYYFPPVRKIARVRSWNTAKYLSRLGWDVTVVTPACSVWRTVDDVAEFSRQIEKEGIHQIRTEHKWRFLDPGDLACCNRGPAWLFGGICRRVAGSLQVETKIGWFKAAESAAASLTHKDVDLILASGPPFVSFKLAKRLSDKLGCPYVLDYRDPWTGNPHDVSHSQRTIDEEQKLLDNCAAVTIVSPSWGEALARKFGIESKLHLITNGYDSEELASVRPNHFGHFALVYAGGFYPPKRVITPVMAALKGIKETTKANGKEWYFHYYGTEGEYVRQEANEFGILDKVVLHGDVPRAEALSAVRGANIALVITSVEDKLTKEDAGIVPGKLFEMIGLKASILILGPRGADIEAIAEPAGLAHRCAGNDIDAIRSFILDSMAGRVLRPKRPEVYEWRTLINKLNDVLVGATTGTLSPCNELAQAMRS